MGARHRHRATCLALVRAPAYMGARFGGCVPVPAARGNHVQPLPRRVTGIYSSIPGSPAAVAAKPCRGAPERPSRPPGPAIAAFPAGFLSGRPLRPPGPAIAAFPAGFLSGRPLRLTELAGALAGPAFLTYVNNQYSTFMPYVKNDPALFPIPALPSSRSHHIPHPMPGRGQAEGRGGSPLRQGRAKCRAERRAPPLNAGWREKRNGAGKPLTSGPGEMPGGTARPAAQCRMERKAERGGEAPHVRAGREAERNGHVTPLNAAPFPLMAGRNAGRNGTPRRIRAGRGKEKTPFPLRAGRGWRTGRGFLSYQSRARTADGAGMEARPPGRSVERLAAAQA